MNITEAFSENEILKIADFLEPVINSLSHTKKPKGMKKSEFIDTLKVQLKSLTDTFIVGTLKQEITEPKQMDFLESNIVNLAIEIQNKFEKTLTNIGSKDFRTKDFYNVENDIRKFLSEAFNVHYKIVKKHQIPFSTFLAISCATISILEDRTNHESLKFIL